MPSSSETLIEELKKIRNALVLAKKTPESVYHYLKSHKAEIERYLLITYEEHTEEKRKALAKTHRELNEASAIEGFDEDALAAVRASYLYMESEVSFIHPEHPDITDDDIHQLIRGLQYAKYLMADSDP
jgi:hypothetical protein